MANDSDTEKDGKPSDVDKKLPRNPMKPSDPVRDQRKKDKPHKEKVTLKPSFVGTKIRPPMRTRLQLEHKKEVNLKEGDPRIKYVIKKSKKMQKKYEGKRTDWSKERCIYGKVELPDPKTSQKLEKELTVISPGPSSAKVPHKKVTPTASWLYPRPQTSEELRVKKPKSGIYINLTGEVKETADYDSFDLVFARKPRPDMPKRRKHSMKRKPGGLDQIDEGNEDNEGKMKRRKKKKKKSAKGEIPEEEYMEMLEREMEEEMMEGEGDYDREDYLTKQFRRKVSQISKSTSYQSKDIMSEISEEILDDSPLSKVIQKYRRESEIKRYQPKKRKFRRGTLESHSFTNLDQPILKHFFFGCKEGTMHMGDENFLPETRNNQGMCIPVAAFCYAFIKHPNKWTTENIDEILTIANDMYSGASTSLHKHPSMKILNTSETEIEDIKELKPNQMPKYCIIDTKKVKFQVEEPEVTGMIRSTEKTVFNLTKGLNIFFARNKAGVLQTKETNIAIWKDKYFYLFDGKGRTKDLYYSERGTAILANFYDIPALATAFLQRSNFLNWPFIIYPIKVTKVLGREDIDPEETRGLDSSSNYNILNETKAVLLGSFDLGDKCFDFTRNKQSLTMAVVALVYSRITPPSAWQKTTVEKIMVIGNQLYIECMKCDDMTEVMVDNLPAIFTVGPYIVEIYIFVNRYADFIFRKCNCRFSECLSKFFEHNTNAIVQFKSTYLAIWKQRNMFYCFDPYPRDCEGFKCRDGVACVTMHATLQSLVDVVTTNFNDKDAVFYIHALKVCKINRDPVQSEFFPKNMPLDSFSTNDFKTYSMKKSKKPATAKPITVDYSGLAARRLLLGEELDPSVYEIGSVVESLGMEQLPSMVHRMPSKSMLKNTPLNKQDIVADLDSPALSDTQLDPMKPDKFTTDIDKDLLDLDSFALTQEEIELEEVYGEEQGEGEGEDGYTDFEKELEKEMNRIVAAEEEVVYKASRHTQVGPDSLLEEPSKISEQINTDITYFPIHKEILYPTYLRDRQMMKVRHYQKKKNDWEDVCAPREPEVTQSEELRRESNFVDLPDGTQIVRGTRNAYSSEEDVEFVAPFICIMAGVVAKKYTIVTWTPDVIDYVIKCGTELYRASKFRFDQVSKIEISKISLGKETYSCLVEYVFDSYTRQNILELSIQKILFVRSNFGVLVTPTYACALFYRNHLYYLYDCFGNNEVGLSEGPFDSGTACFSRFKTVRELTARIMYNKRKRETGEEVIYTRFVLSVLRVKAIRDSLENIAKKKKIERTMQGEDDVGDMDLEAEDGGEIEMEVAVADTKRKKEPDNKVGYQYVDGFYVIEGTGALSGKEIVSDMLKADHFVCLCACLMLLSCPVKKWDTRRVDRVLDNGNHVFSHADDLEISEKRTIRNVLIGKNFFDVIVRKLKIASWRDNRNMSVGIDTILRKKMTYFLIQFPNACYVIHKTQDGYFHIFDPYGVPKGKNGREQGYAGWIRCANDKIMKRRLRKINPKDTDAYDFYFFEVTSIRKAPKSVLVKYKLDTEYDMEKETQAETFGKPFYEDCEWLRDDLVPWSRRKEKNAEDNERGTIENMWYNWDVEIAKNLFSLMANIHQNNDRFSDESRGRQTLANMVTCFGMLEIYDLSEWNAAVLDSVLVNGDNYFLECIKDIKDDDYEISIDDLKSECSIFPFTFTVEFTPVVEGTMFLVRATQFNLYKALRFFFANAERRMGIICCTKSGAKKSVAFGKTQKSEYFMFDCDTLGSPMFLDGQGVAYMLRMTEFNRLVHVLAVTLRGGDFYVYEVKVNDLKPIS